MGLGKTIQVISFLLKLKDEKKLKHPAIVVCPTTLVGNWVKELAAFAPTLKVGVFQGVDRVLDFNVDVLITTFAILRIDIEQFKKQNFSAIIVDEAQNIKNPDTAQTQAVKILKSDIIGMKAFVENEEIGIVTDIYSTGANYEVFEVKNGKTKKLIPYHKDFIETINVNDSVIIFKGGML